VTEQVVIESISKEQIAQLRERLGDKGLRQLALTQMAKQFDNPEGFAAFFELMHGTRLHKEGMKWARNAYKAHSLKKGLAQKCHRESGKTTVFSKFFLSFRIGKEPHKVNSIIRINDDKANETSAAVAHIIEHDQKWRLVFPHVVPDKERGWGANGYFVKRDDLDEQAWNEIITQSPDGPSFVGYGWKSGSIIGSRFNGCVIVDDIHDEENTSSDRQLKSVHKFYTDTLQYCIMDDAWEIWNYTPWVTNDVYAFIESTGEYLVSESPVMRPGVDGDPVWPADPFIPISGRPYKLYWPEVWGFERISKMYRRTGQVGFARMMLLDLEATKGLNLKREWLHEYPAAEIGLSWPVYFGIDYASTADKVRNKDRDYFTLAVLKGIPGGGLVLIDGVRRKISKGESMQLVQSMAGMYPRLMLIGVENIGKGEEFYNDLVLLDDIYGNTLPLLPIKHGHRSKGDRFENWLGPRFQMGRIWITDTPTPFVREFVDEWITWPNAEHDDCLDGVYMGAVAGEGAMPSSADRTGRTAGTAIIKPKNPYAVLARS